MAAAWECAIRDCASDASVLRDTGLADAICVPTIYAAKDFKRNGWLWNPGLGAAALDRRGTGTRRAGVIRTGIGVQAEGAIQALAAMGGRDPGSSPLSADLVLLADPTAELGAAYEKAKATFIAVVLNGFGPFAVPRALLLPHIAHRLLPEVQDKSLRTLKWYQDLYHEGGHPCID